MPVSDAPADDAVRQTYNFAPGTHGLVYRADGPDYTGDKSDGDEKHADEEQSSKTDKSDRVPEVPAEGHHDTKYKLQAMRWGESCVPSMQQRPSELLC
jgi:hypothetical protein